MNRRSGTRVRRANPESGSSGFPPDSGSAPASASRLFTRRFLISAAAGLVPAITSAQTATRPAAKPHVPDEFSAAAPERIEVHARTIPSFDTRDRGRTRFGALEYRSGLVLTSSFRAFGGLSGWRLDAKGEQFI